MIRKFSTNGSNGDAWPSPWITNFGGGSGTADIQSNQLRLITPATGAFGGSARALMMIPHWDFDIYVRVTPGAAWITEAFVCIGIGDTFAGVTNGPNNAFISNLGGASSEFNFASILATSSTTQLNPGYTYTASNPINLRIFKSGLSAAVKIWDDGTNEPALWASSGSITASAAPNTGLFGLIIGTNTGSAASAVTFSFDNLSINDLRLIRRNRRRR